VRYTRASEPPVGRVLLDVARNGVYQAAVVAIVILNLRHILFRMKERDVAS
jgi:hypothetical protein